MSVSVIRVPVPVLVLAALLTLGACGSDPPLPQPVAPTPATTYLDDDHTMRTRATLAWSDVHRRLREHYDPPWDISLYELPATTSWETITAHYTRELGADWSADDRYPEERGLDDYRTKVWGAGDRAVAIALIEGRPAGRFNVLAVLVPDDDR